MTSLSWISSNPDYINQMIRNTQVTLSNNYNDLDNIPIIKITSTTNNPQKIWELKEGLYIINGVAQVDNNTSYEVSNLLISMTARLENGKYILSAFIPYLRGLFEYILKTNSTEYEQHQKIVLMIKNDTLTLDNETIYTPIENYHPATKKYVDDKANEIIAELDRMGVNKENLESLNKENRIRDIKLQALLSETSDRNITIEENVRYFDMPLSIDNGIVTINEIVGETLVNVCDQEESVAITKSYTVENENHIALQGEYDGSCRPVVHGNTLVNHNADWDGKVQTGVETSASGTENVQVEGIKGQEVSVVVEGNTVLNHALGKTSAVVSSIESENDGNYVDLTVANDMSSVVEIEGRTMYYNNDTGEYLYEFVENSNLSLKSSYECEVTEDGKYKVDVKVTGKNKWDGYWTDGYIEGDTYVYKTGQNTKCAIIKVQKNTTYTITRQNGNRFAIGLIEKYPEWEDKVNVLEYDSNKYSLTFTTSNADEYVIIYIANNNDTTVPLIQLEEGTVATSYEPYFESTKTFYLNSPLLEGDKIVTKNGKVYHYHKMGKVVLDGSEDEGWFLMENYENAMRFKKPLNAIAINTTLGVFADTLPPQNSGVTRGISLMRLDYNVGGLQITLNKSEMLSSNIAGFKRWLQANPTTAVYELASPYYELIDEYNNTILNIPKNVAHLTHTSAVPVNNTTFTNYKDELNVLEPNTQYRVMFDCDKANIPFTVTLGGTSQEVTSKKGTHSLLITTPSELVDKNLVIDGIGRCGIDNIRIFKGDVEYDYVKGLWSGYEERKLENLWKQGDVAYNMATIYTIDVKVDSGIYTLIFDAKHTNMKESRIQAGLCKDYHNGDIKMEFDILGSVHVTFYATNEYKSYIYTLNTNTAGYIGIRSVVSGGYIRNVLILEGDWTDNPPTYEEVIANEGKYAVKVKLDTNANIFGKGGRL